MQCDSVHAQVAVKIYLTASNETLKIKKQGNAIDSRPPQQKEVLPVQPGEKQLKRKTGMGLDCDALKKCTRVIFEA